MCLLRIDLPNLCPNMNHFDAVDFSECHSEEVKVSFDAQCSTENIMIFNTFNTISSSSRLPTVASLKTFCPG